MGKYRTGLAVSWLAVVGLGLVISLAACGDDDSGTTPTTLPTTTTTTTQPPAGVTLIRGSELIAKRQLFLRDLTVAQRGRLDITVEYTHPENWILYWLTDRKCSRVWFENDGCDYLTKSLGGASPRKGTLASVAPGTYTFIISNDGPVDDQVTYSIVLTP